MTLDSLAHSLRARKSGSSTWMARCPAHEDRNPSLAITERDGKVLFFCHAGCRQEDVLAAIEARGIGEFTRQQVNRAIVATYPYTDEDGKLLYEVVRFEPKGFAQRRPDGYGGWLWKKGTHQVLYHLPEVLEAPTTFLVEGEKDVETLRDHGFVATTNAGGANAAWLPQFTEALRGREVILIPDNDEPGLARAAVVGRALLGIVARLRLIRLPDDVKDISDWLAAGHSEVELISILEGPDAM